MRGILNEMAPHNRITKGLGRGKKNEGFLFLVQLLLSSPSSDLRSGSVVLYSSSRLLSALTSHPEDLVGKC